MKKQIRRAMICTVAMMLIGVVSLTGVTYAWFSKSDEADVNGLEMEVVSRDGGVYVSTMPYKDFGTSITINPPEGAEYNPVSTAGQLDENGNLKFFEGFLSSPSDRTLDIKAITDPGNYFIRQNVYFDNSTGSTPVRISLAGTEIIPKDAARNTHLAARVAIVTHGHITQEQFNVGAEYPTTTNNANVQIYENNAGMHTQQGINEYTKFINPNASSSGTYNYFGVNSEGTDVDRFNDGKPLELTDMSETGIVKTSPDSVIIEVPAGCYLRTTLYVWLEGQDPDCQNNISGKPYTAAIKFTKIGGGEAAEG